MKKSLTNLLLLSSIFHANDYNFPIIEEEKVLDCIMSMYFYLLLEEKDEKKEEYYEKFTRQYDSLTPEQQEQVKQDYLSIINEQEKTSKELIKQPKEKPE